MCSRVHAYKLVDYLADINYSSTLSSIHSSHTGPSIIPQIYQQRTTSGPLYCASFTLPGMTFLQILIWLIPLTFLMSLSSLKIFLPIAYFLRKQNTAPYRLSYYLFLNILSVSLLFSTGAQSILFTALSPAPSI